VKREDITKVGGDSLNENEESFFKLTKKFVILIKIMNIY